MANLSIPAIRERLFNTSKHEQTTQRSTNPFAASSFKGNVLTADVFESSTKQNQPSFTGKLKASALVGSISGIGERFQHIIDSVVEFGVKFRDYAKRGWDKINGIEISFNPLKERMASLYASTKEVMTKPHHISEIFSTGVSAKQVAKMEDMSSARNLLADSVALWEAAA